MARLLGAPPEHRRDTDIDHTGAAVASPNAGACAATPPKKPRAVAPPPALTS